MTINAPSPDDLAGRARRLGLHGLVAHWDELRGEPWVQTLLEHEEKERQRRSLERRIRNSKIGRFKPMADFDWSWPTKIDRLLIEELLQLGFLEEAANIVLVGSGGLGKTTIAQNLGLQALVRGYTVRFVSASQMLNDLAAQDTSSALGRRLRRYVNPALLVVDEVGYLSYDSRAGDLLFEVISRRHEKRPIVLTTNKVFKQWNEVFPNSSCVTAMVDRLVHRAEIVKIEGESYRAKEARERAEARARERGARSKAAKTARKATEQD